MGFTGKNIDSSNITPNVSVITVCFNAKKTIGKAIKSVIEQTYEAIEYVIIDGGSTDGTLDILHQYNDKIAVQISERDKGIYDAMNKGLLNSSGEYVLFLNADDYFVSNNIIADAVSKIINQEADAICGAINFINEDGQLLYKKATKPGDKWAYVMHQAFLYKREMHNVLGFYNITYKINADYDFYVKLLSCSQYRILYTDVTFSNMQVGGATTKHAYLSATETLHIHLKNNFDIKRAMRLFFSKVIKIYSRKVFKAISLDAVAVSIIKRIKK